MEFWRPEKTDGEYPKIFSATNTLIALGIEVGLILLMFVYSALHDLFDKEEEIIPIDLTVVVNENLNGKENEPPPLKKAEEPKPKPKPPEPVKPKIKEKPKELEKIVTNIVQKVDKKVEKKPAPPKKTKAELNAERIARIKQNLKAGKKVEVDVRSSKESGDGRTDKRPPNWKELLNAGYRPGATTQVAANELQLGYSLIKSAFEEKWDKPAWTDTLKPMTIRVWFGNGGKIVNYKLEKSSGDVRADQSIKSAASRVGAIPALPAAFIDKFRSSGVPVEFTVKPQ